MGNAHGKRNSAGYSEDNSVYSDDGSFRPASPPASPGSPLTYSPQIPMEPFSKDEFPAAPAKTTHPAEFYGASAWPAQPKLVPTVIQWKHGGSHVELQGSFDNWSQRHVMQRNGRDFMIVKLLPPGVYQYKFIVDGEWKYAPDQDAVLDEGRNVNNVLEVYEHVPENLESLTGFEPPPSPPSSYTDAAPTPEDYAREPPALPPHLQLTLLNVPPALDANAALPRPQHVILNHMYCKRGTDTVNAMVVGTTHRYKSKYVTTVMYKPKPKRRSSTGAHAHSSAGRVPMAPVPPGVAGQPGAYSTATFPAAHAQQPSGR